MIYQWNGFPHACISLSEFRIFAKYASQSLSLKRTRSDWDSNAEITGSTIRRAADHPPSPAFIADTKILLFDMCHNKATLQFQTQQGCLGPNCLDMFWVAWVAFSWFWVTVVTLWSKSKKGRNMTKELLSELTTMAWWKDTFLKLTIVIKCLKGYKFLFEIGHSLYMSISKSTLGEGWTDKNMYRALWTLDS